MEVLEGVADVLGGLEFIQESLRENGMAALAEAWPGIALRYARVAMRLVVELVRHPEWARQVETVLNNGGCPALAIPLIEAFLKNHMVDV